MHAVGMTTEQCDAALADVESEEIHPEAVYPLNDSFERAAMAQRSFRATFRPLRTGQHWNRSAISIANRVLRDGPIARAELDDGNAFGTGLIVGLMIDNGWAAETKDGVVINPELLQ